MVRVVGPCMRPGTRMGVCSTGAETSLEDDRGAGLDGSQDRSRRRDDHHAYSELDQVASLAVVGIVDEKTFSCTYDVLAARRTCATAPPKDPVHVSVGHGDGSAPWVADPPLVAHGLSCRSVPVGQLPDPGAASSSPQRGLSRLRRAPGHTTGESPLTLARVILQVTVRAALCSDRLTGMSECCVLTTGMSSPSGVAARGAERLAQQPRGGYRPLAPDACPDTCTVHGKRLAQSEYSAGAGRKKQ